MPLFAKLDDTPMFRKRLQQLMDEADVLRDRSHKLYRASKKYSDSLADSAKDEQAFAKAIDAFATAGGPDDATSIALGGPVMARFVDALKELRENKNVLKSQVDHMLVDRIGKFKELDLHNLRDVRRKLERSSHQYDQAREKFLSLKKDAKPEVMADAEMDLQAAKTNYEQARFAFASALCSIDGKKKYEYVESVACTLDAHLRFFKQGYERLKDLEPFIQQVLTFSQQAREAAQQEHLALATQVEDYMATSQKEVDAQMEAEMTAGLQGPYQPVGGSSQKAIEELMMSAAFKGKVQVIRQGYLLKRSSNLRGDWQRRFFVLDSRGMLYYYRKASVLSFKSTSTANPANASTPINSPPINAQSGAQWAAAGPAQGSGMQGLLQSGMQGIQSGVSSVSSLLMHVRPTNSTPAAAHNAPDSPDSPIPRPAPAGAATAAAPTSAAPSTFSVFSRVLNTRRDGAAAEKPPPGSTQGASFVSGLPSFPWRGGVGGAAATSAVQMTDSDPGSSVDGSSREGYALVSESNHSSPHASPPRETGPGGSKETLASAANPTLQMAGGMHEGEGKRSECQVINLLTATVKLDAEQSDLRFCFRIVTPTKTFTLQAENAAERMDWVEKLTAVIASRLNIQLLEGGPYRAHGLGHGSTGSAGDFSEVSSLDGDMDGARPLDVLQAVPGNAICVDCSKPGPDWASLNLGVLMCIECSGVHRNLGVQVSKVRSLTLDVRIWEEAPVIAFFRATGNAFGNTMWEEGLHLPQTPEAELDQEDTTSADPDWADVDVYPKPPVPPMQKPQPQDAIQIKEKYIQAKYVEKRFLVTMESSADVAAEVAKALWDAVQAGDIQRAVRLLLCAKASVHIRREEALGCASVSEDSQVVPHHSSHYVPDEAHEKGVKGPLDEQEEWGTQAGAGVFSPITEACGVQEETRAGRLQGELREGQGLNDGARYSAGEGGDGTSLEGSRGTGRDSNDELAESQSEAPGELVQAGSDSGRRQMVAGLAGRMKGFIRSTSDQFAKRRGGGGGGATDKQTQLSDGTKSMDSSENMEGKKGGPGTQSEGRKGSPVGVPGTLSEAGWTLLHLASFKGDLGSIEMLLQHGAPVDAVDREGRTPLFCAVFGGHTAAAKHLISRGASTNVRDSMGLSPFDFSAKLPESVVDSSLLAMLS